MNDAKEKAFTGLLDQKEVGYLPLSASKGKACANCRWFHATGDDMESEPHCHLVMDMPEPILATGYCNRWEGTPPPPEPPAQEPIPVVIVEPEMQMDMAKKEAGVLDRIKALLFPEKDDIQAFSVFKGADGKQHWHARYTNNFEDRDKQIISEKALADYIMRLDMGIVPMPELWDWHTKGTRHGQADTVFGIGHFVHAIGHYDDTELGRKAADYDRKHSKEIRLSHGFTAPKWSYQNGVYEVANTFEITKLPNGAEANPFTYFEEVKTMELTEVKRSHLEKVYGKELVDKLVAESEKHGKALEALGVIYKDFAEVDRPADAKVEKEAQTEPGLLLELVKQQGELADLLIAVEKAHKTELSTVKTASETQLADVLKSNAALVEEVKELRTLVNAGPRKASEAPVTMVVNEVEKAKLQAANSEFDPFFADMKIKKEAVK